jgi:hypothetical protein
VCKNCPKGRLGLVIGDGERGHWVEFRLSAAAAASSSSEAHPRCANDSQCDPGIDPRRRQSRGT